MKYTNDHGNVCVCVCVHLIDCTNVIFCFFFKDSTLIYMHNQAWQDELALEKCWISIDGFFHLATTLIWIHAVDCWKLAQFHKILKQDEMSIVKFVGVLAWQLVN